MFILPDPIAFEWDQYNQAKNWLKHKVLWEECEESFFDPNKKIYQDVKHSMQEPRYLLLGKTKHHRILFSVFTVRKRRIRIISARPLNNKERPLYEKAN